LGVLHNTSSVSHIFADTGTKRRATFTGIRVGSVNVSNVEVRSTDPSAQLERCEPAWSGPFTQPDLTSFASNLMQGLSATLTCTVRAASGTTTETLSFSAGAGQVTLGTNTFVLTANRGTETLLGFDDLISNTPDSGFSYSLVFLDNSSITVSR